MASAPSPISDEPPPIDTGDTTHLTLLQTAAMSRPLDEVASLAHLLNQTGERPRPGDEALHMAAVSRPLDDVRQLISLLKKPPHTDDEADTALRAAAAERPIEEVAELINSFRPGADASVEREAPHQEPPPRPFGPQSPASPDQDAPKAAAIPTGAPPPPSSAPAVGRPAPEAAAATAGAARVPALRSVLRWPAAAALLMIGVIHLPTDITAARSGNTAAYASMGIAAICLILACLLPLHDPVWVWALGAAVAVATAVVHAVGARFTSVHLLRDSLGGSFTGATTLAVLCAVVTAGLAVAVLLRKSDSGQQPTRPE